MKIKDPTEVLFETLFAGDAFGLNDETFMVIRLMTENYNAVQLETGELVKIKDNALVMAYPEAQVVTK